MMQSYDLTTYRFFCIGSINFMFNNEKLMDFTALFSPKNFNENDKIILEYFQ